MASFTVVFAAAARRDIDEAELWLVENAGRRAASVVMDRIAERAEKKLTTDALYGSLRPEFGEQMRFVQAPPYLIYYEVNGQQVSIVRVLHRARDRDAIMRPMPPSDH